MDPGAVALLIAFRCDILSTGLCPSQRVRHFVNEGRCGFRKSAVWNQVDAKKARRCEEKNLQKSTGAPPPPPPPPPPRAAKAASATPAQVPSKKISACQNLACLLLSKSVRLAHVPRSASRLPPTRILCVGHKMTLGPLKAFRCAKVANDVRSVAKHYLPKVRTKAHGRPDGERGHG